MKASLIILASVAAYASAAPLVSLGEDVDVLKSDLDGFVKRSQALEKRAASRAECHDIAAQKFKECIDEPQNGSACLRLFRDTFEECYVKPKEEATSASESISGDDS